MNDQQQPPKRKRAPGGGMKPDDGAKPIERKQVGLDPASMALLLKIGRQNLSLGVREAARRLVEHDDVAPFDVDRHEARRKK